MKLCSDTKVVALTASRILEAEDHFAWKYNKINKWYHETYGSSGDFSMNARCTEKESGSHCNFSNFQLKISSADSVQIVVYIDSKMSYRHFS